MDKDKSPLRRPADWVFRVSMLLLGAVIALNLAIALLRPILPWLIGTTAMAALAWVAVAIVRWRRSRW
ncbi:MAG: hypothetical protein ACRDTE_10935 [Pseudonocardiaceae bacterium]